MAFLFRGALVKYKFPRATLSLLQHLHSSGGTLNSRRSMSAVSSVEGGDKMAFDVLSTLFTSALCQKEGPKHHWLNNLRSTWKSINDDRCNLVLHIPCETFVQSSDLLLAFKKMKHLQQRFPGINIFTVLSGRSYSQATQGRIINMIMKDYITFPILVAEEGFTEVNGACYLLFRDSVNYFHQLQFDEEIEEIAKVISQFDVVEADNTVKTEKSGSDWPRELEVIQEPDVGCIKNIFLNYPACVSVDEDEGRLFISDSNHHRIIISDLDGRILDCIGSSPGFEDGDFESAKLLRPAALCYFKVEDCLYIVDSENHAIRKADLEERLLQTVYPFSGKKGASAWSWILGKLGLGKEVGSKEPKEVIAFPWHLMRSRNNRLLISSRNLENSWIMNLPDGKIAEVISGRDEATDIFDQLISDRLSLVKEICTNQNIDRNFSISDEKSYLDMLSSVACLQKYIIFCDTDGQRVLKYHTETKDISCIHFSNFGVLGLPYWLACPIERVWSRRYNSGPSEEHIRHITVLPGKCDIQVRIDIPVGTELAGPLDNNSIWRQVRGSASEILPEPEGPATSSEKAWGRYSFVQQYFSKGAAQRWYDNLESVYYEESAPDATDQDTKKLPEEEKFGDNRSGNFNCVINTSPGSSEVVISTVLYLKISKGKDRPEEQRAIVKKVLECRQPADVTGVDHFLENCGDAQDVIFMKPVHIRVKISVEDYPPGRETPRSDSTAKITISVN